VQIRNIEPTLFHLNRSAKVKCL